MVVFLTGIEMSCRIGVHAHEKRSRQTLLVDIDAEVEPVKEDRLVQTLDYDQVVAIVRDFETEPHVALVETLAMRIAAKVIAAGGVRRVRVRVTKGGAIARVATAGAEVVLETSGCP